MGEPNICNRCGNAYAGSFDNDLYCEQCHYDNSKHKTPILATICLLLFGLGTLWGFIWVIGKLF